MALSVIYIPPTSQEHEFGNGAELMYISQYTSVKDKRKSCQITNLIYLSEGRNQSKPRAGFEPSTAWPRSQHSTTMAQWYNVDFVWIHNIGNPVFYVILL